jgi:hypothetical protein
MGTYGIHDRRARCDGATPEVIAVAESAGQHREVRSFGQRSVLMPGHGDLGAGGLEGSGDIRIPVRPGEGDDGSVHGVPYSAGGPSTTRKAREKSSTADLATARSAASARIVTSIFPAKTVATVMNRLRSAADSFVSLKIAG